MDLDEVWHGGGKIVKEGLSFRRAKGRRRPDQLYGVLHDTEQGGN